MRVSTDATASEPSMIAGRPGKRGVARSLMSPASQSVTRGGCDARYPKRRPFGPSARAAPRRARRRLWVPGLRLEQRQDDRLLSLNEGSQECLDREQVRL